eukprot:691-Heterococcus_DN1.PRE.3
MALSALAVVLLVVQPLTVVLLRPLASGLASHHRAHVCVLALAATAVVVIAAAAAALADAAV